MRELLLFRHAKSRWDEQGPGDHERDLAPRGEAAAPKMGQLLRAKSLVPDLALISTAKRAIRTFELAFAGVRPVPVHRYEEKLYDATPDRLLTFVRAQDAVTRRLMLIGHNPGFELFTAMLAGPNPAVPWHRGGEKFPTAAIAWFELAIDAWAEAGPENARLAGFFRPRELD